MSVCCFIFSLTSSFAQTTVDRATASLRPWTAPPGLSSVMSARSRSASVVISPSTWDRKVTKFLLRSSYFLPPSLWQLSSFQQHQRKAKLDFVVSWPAIRGKDRVRERSAFSDRCDKLASMSVAQFIAGRVSRKLKKIPYWVSSVGKSVLGCIDETYSGNFRYRHSVYTRGGRDGTISPSDIFKNMFTC